MNTTDEAALEKLLEEILHSDLSLQRAELFRRMEVALPKENDFAVFLIERRRFTVTRNDIDTPSLYLPFLSVWMHEGRLKTFASPSDVLAFVSTSNAAGYEQVWARQKSLAYARGDSYQLPTMQLIERILLCFYYACGHYEHFMANASRRFVRNFLKEERSLTIEQVIQAIEDHTHCEVAYVECDGEGTTPKVVYDRHNAYGHLSPHRSFQEDFLRAIGNGGTFSGRSPEGMSYVIHTASLERGYHSIRETIPSGASPTFQLGRRKHVLVLAKSTGPLSMDSLKFGPHLFTLHLANDAFSLRERLIFEVYNRVSEIEHRFIADPPATSHDREALTIDIISHLLEATVGVTSAELLVVRTYDPFTKSLKCIAVNGRGRKLGLPEPILVGLEGGDPVADAFLRSERQGATEIPSFARQFLTQPDPSQKDKLAGTVFPLKIGRLTRGTLECYSTSKVAIQFDDEYLRAIAGTLSDIVQRLETAADVAWLSRLSFLHSARHELENFLLHLETTDPALYRSLRTILDRYSGLSAPGETLENGSLANQVSSLLKTAIDAEDAVSLLIDQAEMIEDIFVPDAGFKFMFREVISTLVNNATKHSTLRIADFQLDFVPNSSSNLGLAITYLSGDKRISPSRASKVAAAPIPDAQSTTFHYGLFLVAAQVRMNGGVVYVDQDAEPELDTIPFKICFTLPLDPSTE